MKTKILISILLVVGLMACQKEPDESILQNPTNCTLKSIVYHDDLGNPEDTCEITYSGSDITRADYSTVYITLEYTSGRVSRRNLIIQGTTTPLLYDLFTYNADGTFKHIESYFTGLGAPLLFYTYDFTYSNGKIAEILEMQDTTVTGGQLFPLYKYTFTYSGDNITHIVEDDLVDLVTDTYDFQYDNNPNYYNKIPNLFFIESIFIDLDSSTLPLALSGNNVTKIINAFGNTDLSYTEENGNIKELFLDGVKLAKYVYNCQ